MTGIRSIAPLAVALFLGLVTAPAAADVLPVDVQACEMLAYGAACTTGANDGFCRQTTCTRFVGADGSSSTPMDYTCLRCIPGAPPSSCNAQLGTSGSAGLAVLFAMVAGVALARRARR